MKNNKFETPTLEIIYFNDIIVTSSYGDTEAGEYDVFTPTAPQGPGNNWW